MARISSMDEAMRQRVDEAGDEGKVLRYARIERLLDVTLGYGPWQTTSNVSEFFRMGYDTLKFRVHPPEYLVQT